MQAMIIEPSSIKEPVSYQKTDRRGDAQRRPEQSFKDAIRKAAETARNSEPMRKPNEKMAGKSENSQGLEANATDNMPGAPAIEEISAMISMMTAPSAIEIVPLKEQPEQATQQAAPLIQTGQTGKIIETAMPAQQDIKGNAEQSMNRQANAAETSPQIKSDQSQANMPRQTMSGQAEEALKAVESEARQKQTTGIEIKPAETKQVKQDAPAFVKPEMALNADKVYVKVGDGGTVNARQFSSDISEKLMQRMADGKQQFDIELMPKELGKISIKLVIEGGKAIFTMQCMNPKTQQLMMMNAESIRNIIQEGTNMQATINMKEDADGDLNYGDLDDRNEKNGQEETADENQEWTEAEATTFMQQLRLGLVGEL